MLYKETSLERPAKVGTWQTHEQSSELRLKELFEEESCLFKSEQISEAQSSSLFPVKQSASPHQKSEAVKQIKSKKANLGIMFDLKFLNIACLIYKTSIASQNLFLESCKFVSFTARRAYHPSTLELSGTFQRAQHCESRRQSLILFGEASEKY